MTTLNITIDDTEFPTTDDDQEAASLLRMAGRDPAHYDLFLIDEHGIEISIGDHQIVNLHEGERFATRRKLRFSVNETRFATHDDDQTAAAVLRLAGLNPTDYGLTRTGPGGGSETFYDEQVVTIADGDKFISTRRQRDVTIVVNTRQHRWYDLRISYTQVAEIAFPGQPIGDQDDVTVRYTYRHGHGGGTLTVGHDVEVKEGMAFDVHRTTRS